MKNRLDNTVEQNKQFFARQQKSGSYSEIKKLTRLQDANVANFLNSHVSGDMLVVGGVWEFYQCPPSVNAVTVLDLSPEMLDKYAPAEARAIAGDLFNTDFAESSFDSIVFAGLLHHTAEVGWHQSENRVRLALRRACRWLRPNGRVFILEYCPHIGWYPIQRALFPFTKMFLKIYGQPMVVMHTRRFYERTLVQIFREDVDVEAIKPNGYRNWSLFPIFLGISWLKLPLIVYPKMHIFIATKH